MDFTIVFLFAGILVLAALMLFIFSIGKKCKHTLNVEHYRVKCLSIEQHLKKDDPSTYQMAILNGDKLVDQAMRESGVKGQTMGERLKNSVEKFSDRNGIWVAHKLRNRIAHESDIEITYEEARYALSCFRKALKDLGAI
jgi:hypothetical protein